MQKSDNRGLAGIKKSEVGGFCRKRELKTAGSNMLM